MPTMQMNATRALSVLTDGGLVLLRTDVGYGLIGCSEQAVTRIYELKGRPSSKPCIAVANMTILDDVALLPDERLRAWIERISARTPIAVVNRTRPDSTLLAALPPAVREQSTSNGTIATFLNAGRLVSLLGALLWNDGRLLVGSSANTSFTGNNYRLEDVPASIRDNVDLEIDDGVAPYANAERKATTILDLVNYRVVREGINYGLIGASWGEFLGQLSWQTPLAATAP